MRFRFLQLSDLHFCSPVASRRLGLPVEKEAQRSEEFEGLVRALPGLVAQYSLNAVFIPGDLWDHEKLDRQYLSQFRVLYNTLCNLPVPVVITPGNHDFYSASSFYHNDFLQANGFSPWPTHVVIFSEPGFQTVSLPGWEGKVQVTGRAFHDNTLLNPHTGVHEARLLTTLQPREPNAAIDLLLFHGSRDDFNRFDEKITAPFSLQELLALDFDYTAVGHYHRYDEFKDGAGRTKGAYAGCPFARGLDETGPKYAILGELVKEGLQPAQVTIEKLTLDDRQIHCRKINVTGQDDEDALFTQLYADLATAARAQDIIYCELGGQLPPAANINWDAIETRLNKDFFHVKLDTEAITSLFNIDQLRKDDHALEGRFIRELEAQITRAGSEEEARLLQQALQLGLEALSGQEVVLR